jgi:hypothetical protein
MLKAIMSWLWKHLKNHCALKEIFAGSNITNLEYLELVFSQSRKWFLIAVSQNSILSDEFFLNKQSSIMVHM